MLAFPIKEGFWTDQAIGGPAGRVLTLSTQHATLLNAFLVLFVGLIGTRFWVILSYILHQAQASPGFKKLLPHQLQAVLRNSGDPWQAASELLLVTWAWKKDVKTGALRSVVPIIAALCVASGMFALGLFIPKITAFHSDAGQDYALVKSGGCGFMLFDQENVNNPAGAYGQMRWGTQKLYEAQTYAGTCYSTNSGSSVCNILPSRRISYSVNRDAPCPVDASHCAGIAPKNALQLDTGKISSQSLGVNSNPEDEIFYRRVLTCSPIFRDLRYTEELSGSQFNDKYGDYGGTSLHRLPRDQLLLVDVGASKLIREIYVPYTYLYNMGSISVGLGYQLDAVSSLRNWNPVPDFSRADANMVLFFLSQNSMMYLDPVHDPVFSATRQMPLRDVQVEAVYAPDYPLGVIACADQYSFCDGADNCTPLQTLRNETEINRLPLTPRQRTTVERIRTLEDQNGVEHLAMRLGAKALLANKLVVSPYVMSSPLPKDQWELEVQYWFNITLARLQTGMAEVAAQTPFPPGKLDNTSLPGLQQQCEEQIVKTNGLYQSFSVLALGLLLGLGALIMVVSFCIDEVGGAVQRVVFKADADRRKQYAADHYIQLQRQGFEDAGVRYWRRSAWGSGGVPVPGGEALVARRVDEGTGRSRYVVRPASGLVQTVPVDATGKEWLEM